MSDSYYPFYPGDYQRDTKDLSLMEHGAYRTLLDHYYIHEVLPSDFVRLCRICGAITADEQTAVKVVSEKFFQQKNETLINKRVEREIEKRKAFLMNQARKSRLGVKARRKPTGEPTEQPTGEPPHEPPGQPFPSPSPSLRDKERESADTPPLPDDEKPEKPNGKHYGSKMCKTDFEAINVQCCSLVAMSCTDKKLNPYQLTQKLINKAIHPRAILVLLSRIQKNWPTIRDPWAYTNSIIDKLNFRAQEEARIKEHKAVMKLWDQFSQTLPKNLIPDFDMPEIHQTEAERKRELLEQAAALKGM